MPIDRTYLQQHFASLSDDALAAVDRGELVEAARAIYDEERARRAPATRQKVTRISEPLATPAPADQAEEPAAGEDQGSDWAEDEEAPDWVEEASAACSFVDYPGTHLSPEATHARDVLRAAGIPCFVSAEEIRADAATRQPQVEYRVLVPAALNLKALSILDKEIFNARLEADWKAHFEQVSDEELLELSPDVICAGLADRIERLTSAYEQEVARRRR